MRVFRAWALVLTVVMLAAMLAGCAGQEQTPATPETPAPTEAPAATEAPEETPAEPEETMDPELADPNREWEPVETKFGRLRYPDQFFDYIETEQTENGDSLNVLFRAVIGEKKIDMFEIQIGSGEGDPVGKITDSEGVQRDVYLRFIEMTDLEGLTEGETNRVYAMQESLNFVIDTLR